MSKAKYPTWDYGVYRPHPRVTADIGGESMTRQEFAEECDINTIMSRYEKTGVLNHYNKAEPRYIDFSEGVPDFHAAMNMMVEAEAAFMSLPAVVRRRFENDPAEFVQFASDEGNLNQLREWGLAAPAATPEPPMRVEVVNPPVAPEGAS